MTMEKRPKDAGIPEPTKELTEEESSVTVSEDGVEVPTDEGFDGELYEGSIKDYDDDRVVRELEGEVA